jgi:hypothetical protein
MRISGLLTSVVAVSLVWSCMAGSSPVQPPEINRIDGSRAPGLDQVGGSRGNTRTLWGYYSLEFDLERMEVRALPVRTALGHLNITDFVKSPNCTDCISLEIQEHDPVTRTIKVLVTLRNTTKATGYDVRGVLLPKVAGVRLGNADGYTGLWSAGAHSNRNPYRAFAQGMIRRAFPPDYWDYRTYQISYASPEALFSIGYAIDVSWPDNCREPYSLTLPASVPTFVGDDPATITVDVLDWQDDIERVSIYPFPLALPGYNDSLDFTKGAGDSWWVAFTNAHQVQPASYFLWIKATSAGCDIPTWHKIRVDVQPSAPPPPPDTTDIPVRFYVALDYSGAVPYYTSPSGGKIEFTYSIASKQRDWANKLWNQYGYNLVDDGSFKVMDDNWDTDPAYYHLGSGQEVLAMHQAYGRQQSPDRLSIYFVQTLPPGMYTAFCAWPSTVQGLPGHNSTNVFVVVSPNVWYWQEVVAHESGHAFGSLIDEYLLLPEQGFNCDDLIASLPPSSNYLYCDDAAYYEGNLMYFAMGWMIDQYSLSKGQADWVDHFNDLFPDNWIH